MPVCELNTLKLDGVMPSAASLQMYASFGPLFFFFFWLQALALIYMSCDSGGFAQQIFFCVWQNDKVLRLGL